MQTVKVERKGMYQGVPQWGITGASEITPSKVTAEKWARLENAARRDAKAATANCEECGIVIPIERSRCEACTPQQFDTCEQAGESYPEYERRQRG